MRTHATTKDTIVVCDPSVPARQCGRCRKHFDGDPTAHPHAVPDWWLCPRCRSRLLGDRPRKAATMTT
jgi:DNA-directed RNA polymerase subunit RPC12/RpoP